MSITELVSKIEKDYEIARKTNRFLNIGVAPPSFPVAHALILEDERLIDLEMKISDYNSLRNDDNTFKYANAKVEFSPQIIYSHDETEKISRIVSLIFEYQDKFTVMLGIGSDMKLKKKTGILAKKFLIGYTAASQLKNGRTI